MLIQQRVLACLSKTLAHILQRELYTMGDSILFRCEAEMIHLQPHLGILNIVNLGAPPFGPLLCSGPQLVKDGEEFLL